MKALIALTSIVGFLMVVLPGPLYQYAGVSLGTAFTSLRFGVYVGGAALILIILQVLINRKNVSWGSTFICAILALVAVGMPVSISHFWAPRRKDRFPSITSLQRIVSFVRT